MKNEKEQGDIVFKVEKGTLSISKLIEKMIDKILDEMDEYKEIKGISERTLNRNFNKLTKSLNVEEGKFKNGNGWYILNKDTEPIAEFVILETTIKGSYFYYACKDALDKITNEEIIATYDRFVEKLKGKLSEDNEKFFLKVMDKAIGYHIAKEQIKIQEELTKLMSCMEELKYPEKVYALRRIRKQFVKSIAEEKEKMDIKIEEK